MTAIAATTGTMRSRVDGTLVMTVEFQPTEAQDAFKLFAAPGTQIAIAALKAGTYVEQQTQAEKPKGGELARLAGIWCNEPKFWRWIYLTYGYELDNDVAAAAFVRDVCKVTTRANFDNSDEAAKRFHENIREPYMAYLRANP